MANDQYPDKKEMEKRRSSDQARLKETALPARMRGGSLIVRPELRASGQVERLARRLGVDPDELAAKIPEDTLRRSRYPVLESVNQDGTRSFKHDPGIVEGITTLVSGDKGSPEREELPPLRDESSGRFV